MVSWLTIGSACSLSNGNFSMILGSAPMVQLPCALEDLRIVKLTGNDAPLGVLKPLLGSPKDVLAGPNDIVAQLRERIAHRLNLQYSSFSTAIARSHIPAYPSLVHRHTAALSSPF